MSFSTRYGYYYSDACADNGSGQCDGYIPKEETHRNQPCNCSCHRILMPGNMTIEDYRKYHAVEEVKNG